MDGWMDASMSLCVRQYLHMFVVTEICVFKNTCVYIHLGKHKYIHIYVYIHRNIHMYHIYI